ncbi:hypothetical protein GY45DRAFT_1343615 [Cubamyces sp. BRFM 1775]|nr:hypothetical protein GY45DRAFT_1343615 [Cubamyces sp. BRFM 1775]
MLWCPHGEVLRHSITQESSLYPQKNGFVHTVLEAYGRHNHLRIRPDDVWIAILTQLSFYINAHAEELRGYFVVHTASERLTVERNGNRYTLDYESMVGEMTRLIGHNVVDATLVDWILPNFTTTTSKDTMICSIAMMSTLQRYFMFGLTAGCGIPTVTLDGTKGDWQKILARLERLYDFGAEPSVWANMLGAIIRRFVAAFDGENHTTFWEHIAYREIVSGPDYISGWITAFCVWDHRGQWQAGTIPPVVVDKWAKTGGTSHGSLLNISTASGGPRAKPQYTLDGVLYPAIAFNRIPPGYSTVDVTLNDNGQVLNCSMVAGHVAAKASASAVGGELDTLSPAPQWFLFEKK